MDMKSSSVTKSMSLLKSRRTTTSDILHNAQVTTLVESRWRRIVTPIPVPQSLPLLDRLRRVEPRSMAGLPPVVWQEAEGFLVRDPYGNQWIDLTSGIVLANAGHSHPRIVEAIRGAVDAKLLATYAFPQERRLQLLEKLISLSPIPHSKAILFSAGTEATECAMMLMRRHGRTINPEKVGIVSFVDSFHGRTLAATLASGHPHCTDWISREEVRHYQIPFPFGSRSPWTNLQEDREGEGAFDQCLAALSDRGFGPEHIAGFLLEAVPGWTTWPMPRGFSQRLVAWARTHNVLLCFDEIQSGCGRTGRFFGFEHCEVLPDLFTLGKGLSSSLPVSAVIGRGELLDDPAVGQMSSTHGGNPVCAAAASANLQVLEDERLVEASAETGALVLARLRAVLAPFDKRVQSVHGLGLFISIHFRHPETGEPDLALADAVVHQAVSRGVMMFFTHRGFIKFTPPLCIDPAAALEAADVLGECVAACVEQTRASSLTGGGRTRGPHILLPAKARNADQQSIS